jgi:hypothetical protein
MAIDKANTDDGRLAFCAPAFRWVMIRDIS